MRLKIRYLVPLAAALVYIVMPRHSIAWGNLFAHPELARTALRSADTDGSISEYLDRLELDKGLDERLALQIGFDPEIDADLGPHDDQGSRLVDNFLDEEPDPDDEEFPSEFAVTPNPAPPCPKGAEFADCFADCARSSVLRWIMLGTFAEDNPNPRARHHFHDPEREHSPPPGNHGLDNTSGLSVAPEKVLTELATLALGRRDRRNESFWRLVGALLPFQLPGTDPFNFALRGRSAVDRAFNTPRRDIPSEQVPLNLFALPDAERYLYRGMTAPAPDEREHYLALHFLALGHVLHFLQDMGSVGHVRNDFILEHALGSLTESVIEIESAAAVEDFEVGERLLGLATSNAGVSLPRAFLADHPVATFELAEYESSIGLPGSEAFESRRLVEYFDEGEFDDPTGSGLAEFVNRHFFSNASVSDVYSRPLVPDCNDPGDRRGAGSEAVWIADLPERDLLTNERDGDGVDRFISSPLVPHLARCRAHCQIGGRADYAVPDLLCGAVSGGSVVRDYIEILWPFVLRYTSEFLDSYLAPRIDVRPIGDDRFELINRSSESFIFNRGELRAFYDDVKGGRSQIPLSCDVEETTELAPEEFLACTFGPYPDEAEEPRSPSDFVVAIRGRLGGRGSVVEPEDDWRSADFVTAVTRVRGRQLVVHRSERSGTCDDPDVEECDENRVTDIVKLEFDMAGPLAGEEPDAVATNVTAVLREQLVAEGVVSGDSIARVDFSSPSAEPAGTRIAFGGDVDRDTAPVGFVNASEFYLLDLRFPGVFQRMVLPEVLPTTDNLEGGPKWDGDANVDRIAYSGNIQGDAIDAKHIVRVDVDGTDAEISEENSEAVVGAAHGGWIVVKTATQLRLADPVTGRFTHEFHAGLGRVEACEPGCANQIDVEQASPSFKPDGSQVAFVQQREGEPAPLIHVADLDEPGRPIRRLEPPVETGGYVAWSQDGAWLAYRGTEGQIRVVSPEGGVPALVSRIGGTAPSWLPSLTLPPRP